MMISKDFYSTRNKEALFGVIQESVQRDVRPYQEGILKTMEYVEQNVSKEVPYGISKEDYLIMMNKKVYSIIVPIIQQDVPKKNISPPVPPRMNMESTFTKTQPQKGNRIQATRNDPMFDHDIMKHYEQIPIADYPMPSQPKVKEENMMEQMTRFQNEREMMIEKPKQVKFQLPRDEMNDGPKEMVKNMFEKRVEEYKNQTSSMIHFEDGNEERDRQVEEVLGNRNEYDAIPIDLFEKQRSDYEKTTPQNIRLNDSSTIDHFENQETKLNIEEGGTRTALKKREIMKGYDEEDIMTYGNKEVKKPENSDRFYKDTNYPKDESISTLEKDKKILEFSPYLNHFLTSVMLPKPQITKEKTYKIIISSFYRNKNIFPDQNYFEVKFNPSQPTFLYETNIDKYGTLIFKGKIISNTSYSATIPITFDNISEIRINEVICPVITSYKGGRGPVVYNGPTPVPGQTYFSQFDAIPTKSTGIPQGVYKEPFIYLLIPELEHSYYTTSDFGKKAFAKLIPDFSANMGFVSTYTSNFTKLQPVDTNEFYKYNPTLRGKIDKMTLSMYNYRGNIFNFSIDKLYVEKISPGEKRYSGFCGESYQTTKIKIMNKNSAYIPYCKSSSVNLEGCDTLNSHPVAPGDLLYFFKTTPECDDYVYFEDYIKMKSWEEVILNGITYISLKASYIKDINGVQEEIYINFKELVPGGLQNNFNYYSQFIMIIAYPLSEYSQTDSHFYFNVKGFIGDSILLEFTETFGLIQTFDFNKVKLIISKTISEGFQNENPQSLFFEKGFNVIRVGNFHNIDQLDTEDTNPFEIEIDFPYSYVPFFFKSDDPRNDYSPGDIFFIQHKLQLTYDFSITCKIKDSTEINSDIQGNGLNF